VDYEDALSDLQVANCFMYFSYDSSECANKIPARCLVMEIIAFTTEIQYLLVVFQ
jgi:hypothetical protein